MAEAVTCPNCKGTVQAGDRYCGHCGYSVSGEGWDTGFGRTQDDGLLEALRKATIGEFEIQAELGRGGMAVVFLAHEIALGRKVAIKVLSPALQLTPGASRRFLREARTAASLEHQSIIPIFAVRERDRLVYFIMRWIAGQPLSAVIRRIGPLPIPLVRGLLADVGEALWFAHRRGVLHRDVKPANVLVGREGFVVVTDFGIAKTIDDQAFDSLGLTAPGQLLGTPGYISPEQCRGQGVSPASDQYSLGAMAFEILTGRLPFDGTNSMDVMLRQMSEPVPDILALRPECPPSLAAAVVRMLDKDPTSRFPGLDQALASAGAVTLPTADPLRIQLGTWVESGAAPPGYAITPVSPTPHLSRRPSPNKKPPAMEAVPTPLPSQLPSPLPSPVPSPRQTSPDPTASQPAVRQDASERVSGPGWRLVLSLVAGFVLVVAGAAIWRQISTVEPGRLVIAALPPKAVVFIDGAQREGSTFELTGTAEIKIEAPDFRTTIDTITIRKGNTDTFRFRGVALPPPPLPPPPPPSIGTLVVTGLPPRGAVQVDGARVNGTRFDLSPGRHSIRLEAAGYVATGRQLTIVAGRTDTLAFSGVRMSDGDKDEKPVGSGVLMLRVRPFARIILDGKFVVEDELLVRTLTAGQHRLQFVRDGFETKDTVIRIAAGDTLQARFTLTRKNE